MRKYYGRGKTRDLGAPVLRQPVDTHCQICARDIMARSKRGLIAHHGYQRPYPGEQTSSCFGAKWQPYEESRSAIPPYVIQVGFTITAAQQELERMKMPGYTWSEPRPKKEPKNSLDIYYIHYAVNMMEGEVVYYESLQKRMRAQEEKIIGMKRELLRLQGRYEIWQPKEPAHA